MISKKVILLGKYGVGKSSLIRQFVHRKFSEIYKTTIGVNIDKKIVNINSTVVNLLIWDLAGESEQVKVPTTYKLGTHAVIYVFDLTRPATYENLSAEVEALKSELNNIPVFIAGNKKDLLPKSNLQAIEEQFDIPLDLLTSAKTSENVDALFFKVAGLLL
ncbi:MAG: Rab family GTPase [Bacteroidota bacterium]